MHPTHIPTLARWAAVVAVVAASVATSSRASAAGLYFSDRGVRPMGRAGAFVAGADDLGAIWYNPAGIADAGSAILIDFAWLRFSNEYTREMRIVDADNTVRYVRSPTVNGTSPILPLPTLAGSVVLDDAKRWTIAAGFIAPYVALASYPELVNGQPSPARYTLGSFDGSALGLPGGWVSWKPIPELRIGLGLLALVGIFQSTVTFSASPQDRLIGAPEQPEYDAQSQMRVGPIFAPSAQLGVIAEPNKYVRFGLTGNTPMVVNAPATIKVRMGTSAAFDTATVSGHDAQVRFVFPPIIRAGVEFRPTNDARIEVAYVREFWSMHESIDAVPRGIVLNGIVGAPKSVAMPSITIPRHFRDAGGYRLGGEYHFAAGGYEHTVRMGIAYEESAVPPEYLSLSSLDFSKVIVSLGGSLHLDEHWRFDATYAHLFASSVNVSADTAQIPRINPLKGNAPMEAVNGGRYTASADIIGVGLNYKF